MTAGDQAATPIPGPTSDRGATKPAGVGKGTGEGVSGALSADEMVELSERYKGDPRMKVLFGSQQLKLGTFTPSLLAALDAADEAAGVHRVRGAKFPAKLGWSNPDTGPADLRLYATDRGSSPRWDKPRARVAEDALIEAGCHEGDRFVVVRIGDRFESSEVSR